MNSLRKQKIHDLLKGIETGDPRSIEVVNEDERDRMSPSPRFLT